MTFGLRALVALLTVALGACASTPEPYPADARLAVLVVESESLSRFTEAAKAKRPVAWTGVATRFFFAVDDDPAYCRLAADFAYERSPGRFEPPVRIASPASVRGESAPDALVDAFNAAVSGAHARRFTGGARFAFGWGDEARLPQGPIALPGFSATPTRLYVSNVEVVLRELGVYGYSAPALTSAEGRSVSFDASSPGTSFVPGDAPVTVIGPVRVELLGDGTATLVSIDAPTEPIIAEVARATGRAPSEIARASLGEGVIDRCPPLTSVGSRAREILGLP